MVGIEAADLGSFGSSHEFVKAEPQILNEIYEHLGEYASNHHWVVPLCSTISEFESTDSVADRIVSDFLRAAEADIGKLASVYLHPYTLPSEEPTRIEDMPVILRPARLFDDTCEAGSEHTDEPVVGVGLGVRYTTSNQVATEIPDLPDFGAGSIARLVNGETLHRRPYFNANQARPRVFLALDA